MLRERLQDFTRNGQKVVPTFSATEMERRLKAIRGHMAKAGVDAALFTSYHNINYYSDFLYCQFGRRYGLVLQQEIAFNLSLSSLAGFTRFGGRLDQAAEEVRNQSFFDSLRVKAPNQRARVGGLSGGNQQKVVLGKALMTEPTIVMLDEPTRGIDVGAKLEVYELINRLTADGKAVILVSSELPELMGMSDRIIMLHEGGIGGHFRRAEFTQERLLAAAMGHAPAAA